MSARGDSPGPTAALLLETFDAARGLLRRELDLARAETDRSLRRARAGLVLLALALILAMTALDALAGAAIGALAGLGLGAGLAAMVVGAGLAVLAALVAWWGLRDLERARLAPERVARSLRADAREVREAAGADARD
ncbi:phage holin family protein [Rhodosalinus sediminis]|uniref:Phage holin family protein n=1 Tax=Rhodosalinus sediminis TaxID=1940533 RepID=A0A3D9BPQ9_9RHOB|nr:phage holin family protein [Rhodosalinus sediminis]REC55480.1 phage holin family protein [Rhodosalinus sediminis]